MQVLFAVWAFITGVVARSMGVQPLIDRKFTALVRGDEKLGGSSIRLIDEDGQVAHGRQFAKTALQQGPLQESIDASLPHEPGEQLSLDVIATAKD